MKTPKSITITISELSQGTWSTVTVQRELAKMAKEGEFKRHGTKQIKWNPVLGNRVINYRDNLGYDGSDIVLNEIQHRVIETLRNMISQQPYDTYEDEMKALLKEVKSLKKQVQKQNEILEFLKARANKEDAEMAQEMVRKLVDTSTGKEYIR